MAYNVLGLSWLISHRDTDSISCHNNRVSDIGMCVCMCVWCGVCVCVCGVCVVCVCVVCVCGVCVWCVCVCGMCGVCVHACVRNNLPNG